METSPFMVVVYKCRHGTNLDSVGVVGWIFKQAVVRVEQFSWHQEEKLSGRSTVVQPAIITHYNTHLLYVYMSVWKVNQWNFSCSSATTVQSCKALKGTMCIVYIGLWCRQQFKYDLENWWLLQQRNTPTIMGLVQQEKDNKGYIISHSTIYKNTA